VQKDICGRNEDDLVMIVRRVELRHDYPYMMIGRIALRRQSASKEGAEERINGLHQATLRLSPKYHGLV